MMRSVEPWISLAAVLCAGIYFSISSETFLRFHSIRVADGMIYKIREVPYGTVTAEWTEKITAPDGRVCPASGASGRSTYEDRRVLSGHIEEVHYALDGMADCLFPGAVYQSEHVVILGGLLRLRPVRTAHVIE